MLAEDDQLLMRVTRELVDEYLPPRAVDEGHQRNGSLLLPPKPRVTVQGWPARDEADELALDILVGCMTQDCRFEMLPLPSCANGYGNPRRESERGRDCHPVADGKSALPHLRRLCKQLRGRFESIDIVVGLWALEGDREKLLSD